jgi:hypothetical protein
MTNQSQTKTEKTSTFKRAKYLLGTIVSGIVTYTTLTGDLQKVIHFAGTANEIGFFFMGSLLTMIFAYLTISE